MLTKCKSLSPEVTALPSQHFLSLRISESKREGAKNLYVIKIYFYIASQYAWLWIITLKSMQELYFPEWLLKRYFYDFSVLAKNPNHQSGEYAMEIPV